MLEPFAIRIEDEVLADLARRLALTRLPPEGASAGWEDGTDSAYLRELVAYWRDGFDWRAQEAALNRFSHFRCEVDGTGLHLKALASESPRDRPGPARREIWIGEPLYQSAACRRCNPMARPP